MILDVDKVRGKKGQNINPYITTWKNKNDHRSGGAVKEGCPYLCIKHII